MHRNELPRIYELRDQLKNPISLDAYFQDFENSYASDPRKRKQFKDLESGLKKLDVDAWNHLKKKAASKLEKRNPKRGWHSLFEALNEAKGYNYLKQLGCVDIKFIPKSDVKGQRTPDLQGTLGATKVLCEVKTVNISDDEAMARKEQTVRDIHAHLTPEFFNKLRDTLEEAKGQLDGYDLNDNYRKIAYVFINFDDIHNEYEDKYSKELELFKATNHDLEIEMVFDWHPAFYTAMA